MSDSSSEYLGSRLSVLSKDIQLLWVFSRIFNWSRKSMITLCQKSAYLSGLFAFMIYLLYVHSVLLIPLL